MSFDPAAAPAQRLLPETLESHLRRMGGRTTGMLLLANVALAWASLISWSISDPSLTHTTGTSVRNLLGPLGAVVSDLLLQMLGLGAAFALLAPMFWGIELLASQGRVRLKGKIVLAPVAVALLVGALSALPTPANWPLHHGFGGIFGDFVYSLAVNVTGLIDPRRGGPVAGLLLFGLGAALMARSLGSNLVDLAASLQRRHRPLEQPLTEPRPDAHRFAADPGEPAPAPASRHHAWDRPYRYAEADPGDGFREPAFAAAPSLSIDPPKPMPLARPHAPHRHDAAPAASAAERAESDRDFDLDDGSEAESLAIARRFAPQGADARGQHRPARPDARQPAANAPPAPRKPRFLDGLMRRERPGFRLPSLNLLKRPTAAGIAPELTQTVLRGNARLLEDVLADFGIKGEIKDISPGPVVTLFELEPARGTKSSRVIGLADDIARSMSASSTRVAVVPGRNAIGIELPNVRREPVLLRDVLEAEAYKSSEATLPLALGKSISGEPVVVDLARMPHLLVAGTTGSGKSVGVNAMILSLLYRMSPDDCRFLMIDPKMLELSVYNGIPHLLCPVVTEPQKAVAALNWVVSEMEERYKRMAKLSVRNIDIYNNRIRHAMKRGEPVARTVQTGFDTRTGEAIYEQEQMPAETMPYIVVVVDEFADLMIVAGKEIEAAVQRLAQMARAAGIHLIMATQRPSVDIVTGTIKANFPTRISFKVASKIDSRTILNEQGAEQLLGQGDMLFSNGGSQIVRVHGAFVADEEVESVARSLAAQGEPRYIDGITDALTVEADSGRETERALSADDIFDKAVAVVLRDRKASTSYIQRRLSIGYNRAADLIERMEREGIVGPANAVGKRDILFAGGGDADAA